MDRHVPDSAIDQGLARRARKRYFAPFAPVGGFFEQNLPGQKDLSLFIADRQLELGWGLRRVLWRHRVSSPELPCGTEYGSTCIR